MSIRVLLVEDQPVLRESFRAVLGHERDMVVVAEADTGSAALDLARRLRPDVVVISLSLADGQSLPTAFHVLTAVPRPKVVVTMGEDDPRDLLAAVDAGANGFVSSLAVSDELPRAVRAARRQQYFISPELVGLLLAAYRARRDPDDDVTVSWLGAREREVRQLFEAGLSKADIAARLRLPERTVEAHRRNFLERPEARPVRERPERGYGRAPGITGVGAWK
jgi:DNA-binding NarL/FixJ family response regulator